jgi:hypothetical protein
MIISIRNENHNIKREKINEVKINSFIYRFRAFYVYGQ